MNNSQKLSPKEKIYLEFIKLTKDYINPSKLSRALRTDIEKATLYGKCISYYNVLITLGESIEVLEAVITEQHEIRKANIINK